MLERALLIFALAALAPAAAAAGGEFSYMTLNGIRAVALDIQGIDPSFARYGLTPQGLVAAVETQLRQGGLEIISHDAARARPHAALVQIKFRTNQSEYQFFFYNLALEVRQKIPLGNAAGGFISALIWSDARQGSVQPTDLPRVTTWTADLVAGFLADYHAQNAVAPKRH